MPVSGHKDARQRGATIQLNARRSDNFGISLSDNFGAYRRHLTRDLPELLRRPAADAQAGCAALARSWRGRRAILYPRYALLEIISGLQLIGFKESLY
jgi:hypothetical protein